MFRSDTRKTRRVGVALNEEKEEGERGRRRTARQLVVSLCVYFSPPSRRANLDLPSSEKNNEENRNMVNR